MTGTVTAMYGKCGYRYMVKLDGVVEQVVTLVGNDVVNLLVGDRVEVVPGTVPPPPAGAIVSTGKPYDVIARKIA